MRIVWVNGAFGVGKSSAAFLVAAGATRWRLFDPETVGYMLRPNLAGHTVDDFQDYKAWRTLVPAVALAVIEQTGDDLLAVQTVLNESYWRELRDGLAERDITVTHIVLDADAETLRARIATDAPNAVAETWRLDRIPTYMQARAWLLTDADAVIDTAAKSPSEVAAAMHAHLT